MYNFTFDAKKFSKAVKMKRTIEEVLTTAQAAIHLGISPSELNRIESGKRPGLDDYARLCAWIEKPMTDFVSVSKATAHTRN